MTYSFPFFDINQEGDFYIGFEADSLIYCYDQEFQPKYAFGFQGKKMRTDYPNVHTVDELRYKRTNEKQKYGHYNSVKYIDETGLLFRTYAKGSHYRWDGLQIYDGTTLMGDVEVPKNFRIIGYYDDYYYASCGIDEEKEIISICRFKL